MPPEYGGKTGGKTEEGSRWANERFLDWVLEKSREKIEVRRAEWNEDVLVAGFGYYVLVIRSPQ